MININFFWGGGVVFCFCIFKLAFQLGIRRNSFLFFTFLTILKIVLLRYVHKTPNFMTELHLQCRFKELFPKYE